jgi:hypothetical protein
MEIINIALQFTKTPGARFRTDGDFSGEQFREEFLEKYFAKPNDDEKVQIVLDGAIGYPTSFLEESFGGLVRKFKNKEAVKKKFSFVSNENPLLIDEINEYIENALDEK